MKLSKVFLSGVLLLLVAAVLAVPVSAAPPVIETGEGEWEGLKFPDLCPGFEVWDHMVYRYRATTYFAKDGEMSQFIIHYWGSDGLYNPENPGVALGGNFDVMMRYDPASNQWYDSGIDFQITVPGYGAVILVAGRFLGDPGVHINGKNSFLNPADIEQFCSFLAVED